MGRLKRFSLIVFILAAAGFAFLYVTKVLANDRKGPEISMDSDSVEISVEDDTSILLNGITARDARDGDVTDSLVIENISSFMSDGSRVVSYAAFDSEGNVSKAQRNVTYSDYRSPQFILKAPLSYNTGKSGVDISAEDILDGDITRNIQISMEEYYDFSEEGEYTLNFLVSNSAGDVSTLTATVDIHSSSSRRPVITLTDYIVYVDQGSRRLDYASYLDKITVGNVTYDLNEEPEEVIYYDYLGEPVDDPENYYGTLYDEDGNATEYVEPDDTFRITKDDIRIRGTVDYNKAGSYEVVYTYSPATDEGSASGIVSSESSGTVRLIVVVDDGQVSVGGSLTFIEDDTLNYIDGDTGNEGSGGGN
ncbi:MAG: bacterial Ig-like domain-containing protein [Lachnospiraceae bacterium]|nr:bacterial Ig-like domain-containing protein [Lachnospiraceae bacterium]